MRRAGVLGALAAVVLTAMPGLAIACDPAGARVVIDVGHTDLTPGAISARGRPEHLFNRALAAVLQRALAERGFAAVSVLIRSGEEDLPARVEAINAARPDLIVSLHHDSVQKSRQSRWTFEGRQHPYSDLYAGWSLLVSTRSPYERDSLRLARLIAARLLAIGLPFSTHHAEAIPGESRSFVDPSLGIYRYDGLAVLKATQAPAVLLEAGIILNRDEERALAGRERQQRMADAVADAILAFCAGAT